jgi:hypothetical protein
MIALQDDEETPFLRQSESEQPTAKTPLPWDQFWIILFLQLSDPLSSQTLAPFIPQVSKFPFLERESDHNWNFVKLIRDIGVTHGDESQVGHYAGILVSMSSTFLLICPSLIFPQAIIILCSSCIDCFSLESTIRPDWAQACTTGSSISNFCLDVFVWAVEYLPWSGG